MTDCRVRSYDRSRDRDQVIRWFSDPCFFFALTKCPWALSSPEIDTMMEQGSPVSVIERNGRLAGLLHCKPADMRQRYANLYLRPDPAAVSDWPAIAWPVLCSIFLSLPVRFLAAKVFEFDLHNIWLLESLGFNRIGSKPDDVFISGRYWDAHHYELPRGEHESMTDPLPLPIPPTPVPAGFVLWTDPAVTIRGVRDGDRFLLEQSHAGRGLLFAPTPVHRRLHGEYRGGDTPPVWPGLTGLLPREADQELILVDDNSGPAVLRITERDGPNMRCRLAVWAPEGSAAAHLLAARDYCFGHRNLHRVCGLMWAEDDLTQVLTAGFSHEGTLSRAAFAGGRSRDVAVVAAIRDRQKHPDAAVTDQVPQEEGISFSPLDETDMPAALALFDAPGFTIGLERADVMVYADVVAALAAGSQRWGLWDGDRLCGVAIVKTCATFSVGRLWAGWLPDVSLSRAAGVISQLSRYLVDSVNITRLDTLLRADDPAVSAYAGAGFLREAVLSDHLFAGSRWHDTVVMARFGRRTPGEEWA